MEEEPIHISDHKFPPEVTRGGVRISSMELVIAHDDVEVWEVNFHTKYPEVVAGGASVSFDIGHRTLYGDLGWDHLPTTVEFWRPDAIKWDIVVTNPIRFTATVCLYRRPD